MDLDHMALWAACYEAARKTMMDTRPTDVARIQKLAETFYSLCLEHAEQVKKHKRDPNILVRIAVYLAHTHAIPPMHDSTEWYLFMLKAFVELACPETVQNPESRRFFEDIEEGIKVERTSCEKRID